MLLHKWTLLTCVILVKSDAKVNITGNCSETFDENKNKTFSPNYPKPYNHNDDCSWTLMAPMHYNIELVFHYLNLEYLYKCENDWVAIYDYYSYGNISLIDRLCLLFTPKRVISNSNILKVRFKSNGKYIYQGFDSILFCSGV